MVRDLLLFAILADDHLSPVEPVPRHRWEEVVLNLVVQAAVPEVGQRASGDIARGDHLFAEEIEPAALLDEGHTLVIRSEDRAVVDAEERLVNREEAERERPAIHLIEEEAVEGEVNRHAERLPNGPLRRGFAQVGDAADAHVQRLERQHEWEDEHLPGDHWPQELRPIGDLFGREDDEGEGDVRILLHVIGSGVVLVVLGVPPGMADAEQEIAEEHAPNHVRTLATEGLVVADIVCKERDLGRSESHDDCRKHQQEHAIEDDCRSQQAQVHWSLRSMLP